MPHSESEPRSELQQILEPGEAPAPVGGVRRPLGGRHAVLQAVERWPGLGFRQLVRRTGFGHGTVHHHLAALNRRGLVWTQRHGARLLHFPAPRPDEPEPIRQALEEHVLDALDRDLLTWLRTQPRTQKAVLQNFSGQPRATVQHRLARLVEWGFLRVDARGRWRTYHVTRFAP